MSDNKNSDEITDDGALPEITDNGALAAFTDDALAAINQQFPGSNVLVQQLQPVEPEHAAADAETKPEEAPAK